MGSGSREHPGVCRSRTGGLLAVAVHHRQGTTAVADRDTARRGHIVHKVRERVGP